MELRSLEEALRGGIREKLAALEAGSGGKETQAAAVMLLAESGQLRAARRALTLSRLFDDQERQAVESWLASFGSLRMRRRAETVMRRMIEEYPDSTLFALCRARLLIALHRPGEAAAELERVLAHAPGSSSAQSLLAVSYTRLRQVPRAEAAIAKARRDCPDAALVRYGEMITRLRQRHLAVATEAYGARADLLDIRSFPGIFRVWAATGWAVFAAFAAAALAGMWLRHPLLVGIGSGVMLLDAAWEFNVYRSWRRAGLGTVIALLPWIPLLGWR